MKHRALFFSFICLGIVFGLASQARPASADLVAKLPQVMEPFYMTIVNGRLYIVEGSASVQMYDLGAKGAAFVKAFGRQGQGPGEFNFIYLVRVLGDHLDVSGTNTLARFSLAGEFMDQVSVPVPFFKGAIYRLGDRYVIGNLDFGEKGTTRTIRLVDQNFKTVKEIASLTIPEGLDRINVAADFISARVAGDRVFVVTTGEESFVAVFDPKGGQIQSFKLPLKRAKMTASLKEAILKPLKDGFEPKSQWPEFEKRLYFPDRAPGLEYFDVAAGKIFARTYNYKNDLVEFVIFDLQGKELARTFLPFTGRISNGVLFCFYEGRYYYLKESDDGEGWDLNSRKVW